MSGLSAIEKVVQDAFDRVEKAKQVNAKDLIVRGGKFDAQHLSRFLELWIGVAGKELRWRLYEYPHRFDALDATRAAAPENALPENYTYLERARLFGPRGDLDVRRDSGKIHWHFIGEAGFPVPPSPDSQTDPFPANSEWDKSGEPLLLMGARYYQWRGKDERVDSHWRIDLGFEKPETEVYLNQMQYWRKGNLEFVRYESFEAVGGQNAKG